LHEIALYSKSRMSEQSFVSVHVHSVNSDNISMLICEVSPYKGDGLRLIIRASCSWEMALNVCLETSLDNSQDWKRIHVESKGTQ
jgi:hypothetical protein